MEWVVFLYVANCIYLVSYGVRDVLLLRILAVVAMIVFMPYYLFYLERPMWPAVNWNLAFMVINVAWIVKILAERRPPRFTPDQRKLYELTFRDATPRELLQLLHDATWQTAGPGEVLVEENKVCNRLIVVHSGSVSIRRRGKELVKLRDGDFVGETSFLAKEPSSTAAVAVTPVRYVNWTRDRVEDIFARRLDLKSALYVVAGRNLIEKLSSAEGRLPELSIGPDSSTLLPDRPTI